MSYLQSIHYGGAQSIDGVMLLDGAMPPPPPRVSRPATFGRRTWPAQFHRRNTDPLPSPLGYSGSQMPPPPQPAGIFILATPAASSGSRYPEANSWRQRRPRIDNVEGERLVTEFHPEEGTAVVMLPPPAVRRQRRRTRYVREEFSTAFHDQMEAAAAASADEYEMRTTGASESAIEKLERVEIEWKQDDCCTICLEEMGCGGGGDGEGKLIRLDCKHVFHERCLIPWLKKSNCCPLCRFQIPD